MKISLSTQLQNFKEETETLLGHKIEIKNHKDHPDWNLKPGAFVDSGVIYIDESLPQESLEEKMFHELTHIYFSASGYPKVVQINDMEKEENITLDKILSLVEDLAVDIYLEERGFPYDKYDYKQELKKISEIHESGAYLNVGGGTNTPVNIRLLHTQLMFIKLLTDVEYDTKDEKIIKEICINNLGSEQWEYIKKASIGIRDILRKEEPIKIKLDKAFRFLIKMYNLKTKVKVVFNQ